GVETGKNVHRKNKNTLRKSIDHHSETPFKVSSFRQPEGCPTQLWPRRAFDSQIIFIISGSATSDTRLSKTTYLALNLAMASSIAFSTVD
ncbi:11990_t:CDS:2, partial [Funneliformis caledonium]